MAWQLSPLLPFRLNKLDKLELWAGGLGVVIVAAFLGGTLYFFKVYENSFLPGIYIDNTPLAGLTQDEAQQLLTQTSVVPAEYMLTASMENIATASTSAELGLHRVWEPTMSEAYSTGRTGNAFYRFVTAVKLLISPQHFYSHLEFDSEKTAEMVLVLAAKVDDGGERPHASLTYSNSPNSIVIHKGRSGRVLQQTDTVKLINDSLLSDSKLIVAPVASISTQLNDEQAAAATTRVQSFVGKEAVFKGEQITQRLNDQELIALLDLPTGYNHDAIKNTIEGWEKRIDRPAQSAEFTYDPSTLKVTSFKPPRNGLDLDEIQVGVDLISVLNEIETNPVAQNPETAPKNVYDKTLVFVVAQPEKTLASTNNLGIQEQIGFGESEYAHSIPSRVHNVALAASRINNYIIKPDEEFRFNDALGDVSGATGFQPAYVIKSGQTVLGDGGGVCQVSTTLFRSVLNAGLPVTKRKAHSYRVSYYELDSKPGVDATVYSGEVDLRFKNDTGHHILVHTETDSKNLYMKVELYGTSDGRTTQITDHKTWDFRAPPAPVYIPDTSLAPGRTRQVDWAASGIKASFKNIVKDKNGNLIREEEYFSNYVPWSAKYLRGV